MDIARGIVPLVVLASSSILLNYKVETCTPIHDNIRELVTWERKEHGITIFVNLRLSLVSN
jgi:hypothetical protein